jgi:hypothetical protein
MSAGEAIGSPIYLALANRKSSGSLLHRMDDGGKSIAGLDVYGNRHEPA